MKSEKLTDPRVGIDNKLLGVSEGAVDGTVCVVILRGHDLIGEELGIERITGDEEE